MSTAFKNFILLTLIVFVGAFLRFYDLNWDQGYHLHPDERFLTMVAVAAHIPNSFFDYLNPQTSSLNPTNLNYSFYVYGMLPVTATKFVSVWTNMDNYDHLNLVGRFLSGFFDSLTILCVFKLTDILAKKRHVSSYAKFFAAFTYGITVFAIQQSHFFTVDIPMSFFMFASTLFIFLYAEKKQNIFLFLSAISIGLAISCKLTGIIILPLNLALLTLFTLKQDTTWKTKITFLLLDVGIYGLLSYITVRLGSPYMFTSSNILNPLLSKNFLDSLTSLSNYSKPDAWFPPSVQWLSKTPVIFALGNIALFGLGFPLFLLTVIGFYSVNEKKHYSIWILTLWILLVFMYQSTQFVKTMRYFIYLYPFFAIFAGIQLGIFFEKISKWLFAVIIITLLVWPLCFFSIYTKQQSRVTASQWIYNNLPNNSITLTEYWDDPLPLIISSEKTFQGKELPVFDPDNSEKWKKINGFLSEGDYLILSSNRGWGSIPTVPNRYPLMSKFYADLFAGNLAYKKIAEFTSYPSLSYLGIPLTIPDDIAEEAFTVYDHPKVLIFKNIGKQH